MGKYTQVLPLWWNDNISVVYQADHFLKRFVTRRAHWTPNEMQLHWWFQCVFVMWTDTQTRTVAYRLAIMDAWVDAGWFTLAFHCFSSHSWINSAVICAVWIHCVALCCKHTALVAFDFFFITFRNLDVDPLWGASSSSSAVTFCSGI